MSDQRWALRLGLCYILAIRQHHDGSGWVDARRFYSVRLRWQWAFGTCSAAQPPRRAFDLGPLRFLWSY